MTNEELLAEIIYGLVESGLWEEAAEALSAEVEWELVPMVAWAAASLEGFTGSDDAG